jgi:hypothetical protein
MCWTGDRINGLDVLDSGWDQWSGCIRKGISQCSGRIGQCIGSVAWMYWNGDRISGVDSLDRG